MDQYQTIAKYYDDAYNAKPNLVDLEYYIDCAKSIGGSVLEVGCGTGRVLLPIARCDIEISGLEFSESMLSVLRSKIEKENESLKSFVTLFHGDMRDFRSDKKFDLIIVPFRALQHMYSVSDQIKALKALRNNLSNNGILVFDVFNPLWDKLLSGIGEENFEFEWKSNDNLVKRYFRKESVDKKNLCFSGKFIFKTYAEGELIFEEEDSIKMSFYTYPHLLALFEMSGLEIVEEYGSFDKKELTQDSPEMIFELRGK